MTSHDRNDCRFERLLILHEISFRHYRFQPGGIDKFSWDHIPQGQHYTMQLGMMLLGLTHQFKPIATFQIIRANQ